MHFPHLHALFLDSITLEPWGYFVLPLLMVFEGDILLFTAGFLTFEGYFDFRWMFLAIFAAILAGDLGWYFLGHKIKDHPLLMKWFGRFIGPVDRHLGARTFRSVLISKFTYGLHHLVLMRAGALKIPLSKFMKSDIASTLIWIAAIWGLAFAFDTSFALARHYLKFAEVALLVGVLLFVLAERLITRYLEKDI